MPAEIPSLHWLSSSQNVDGDRDYFVSQARDQAEYRDTGTALLSWSQLSPDSQRSAVCLRPIYASIPEAASGV